MKLQLTLKFFAILAISIGLLFALGTIESKIFERDQYRLQAKASIANGWSGQQIVVSPILSLKLERQYEEEVYDKNLEKYVTKKRTKTWTEWHLPDELKIDSTIYMQERYLGIYKIPVYESEISLQGKFLTSIQLKSDVSIKRAQLIASFADMRGISSKPSISWNQQDIVFETAEHSQLLGNYISADISRNNPASPATFNLKVRLRGMDSIRFVPAAKQLHANLQSEWPHPYFEGRYLPVNRTISDQGFQADWQLTEFATSIQQSISRCNRNASECAAALMDNSFGVGLHNPIDIYQKTERSIKYGFLFIVLTFAVFCLFEVMKRIQIHPVQYGLVGLALAIFYLLLISLSEHMSFLLSYLVAVAACVGLIAFYLSRVLDSRSYALGVSTGMVILYSMLYMILRSEDYAMLMGAILTFIALGIVMMTTRNIDWYQLGKTASEDSDGDENLT